MSQFWGHIPLTDLHQPLISILHNTCHDTSLTMSYFSRSVPVDPSYSFNRCSTVWMSIIRSAVPLLNFVSKSASTVIQWPSIGLPPNGISIEAMKTQA